MKKVIVMALAAVLFVGTGCSSTQSLEENANKEAKKEAQKAMDQALFEEAQQAMKGKAFTLEADRVIFKRGSNVFVNSNTNFVMVNKDRASVQVAFNVPSGGPNGLGGVTVDGNVSSYEMRTDKKGNVYLSMNIMGTGISAQVEITLLQGSNDASVTISPNFNSNRLTLSGKVLPLEKSNVFKGQAL